MNCLATFRIATKRSQPFHLSNFPKHLNDSFVEYYSIRAMRTNCFRPREGASIQEYSQRVRSKLLKLRRLLSAPRRKCAYQLAWIHFERLGDLAENRDAR
jgi:hypothetical protein